jgi:dsDNA-specific endonuclease/ATPase MutS2
VRAAPGDATGGHRARLDPGRLALCLVVEGLPVADLPAGARLRIGDRVILELGASVARGLARQGAGVVEAGETDGTTADVIEGGPVEAGDGVVLESVALPLADVLDLHSFRPEETAKVVADYLGEARRAGLGEVRIVHGRGRGVQRAVVRRLLAETPGVAEFVDAPPGRGGWGATVVRLHPTGPTEAAPSG